MKNYKQNVHTALLFAGKTLLLVCIFILVYLACTMVSCRVTAEGIEFLTGDFSAPELVAFLPESAQEICVEFSEQVRLIGVHVTSETGGLPFADVTLAQDSLSAQQRIVLSQSTHVGERYRISGIVEDAKGNTLSFSIGFSGYNEHVPILILSEVRSEYSNPKSEFVELYAVTSGNLAGVTVYSAYDGVDCTYEFDSCEVAAGEYIVLHYRKLTADCFDESGNNLLLSGGTDASAARDFWVDNTSARIGKSDVILLRARSGGTLLDALLYSESAKADWKNDTLRRAAQEALDAELWQDGSTVEAALNADKSTATRTIGRQNIPAIAFKHLYSGDDNGKNAWMVTATSSASPGKANANVPAP